MGVLSRNLYLATAPVTVSTPALPGTRCWPKKNGAAQNGVPMTHCAHLDRDVCVMKPMVKNILLLATLVLSFGLAGSVWASDEAFQAGPGGLRFKDLQPGQGPVATVGQVATIHFVGWIDEQGARGK